MCRWRCRFHNEVWDSSAQSRAQRERLAGCRRCSVERMRETRMVPNAGRSLAILMPELAGEFLRNVTNPGRGADMLKISSRDIAIWRCAQCNADYPSSVAARTKRISPRCSGCNFGRVQLLELHVRALVAASTDLEVMTGASFSNVRPDLWLPSISIGIDLDPEWSHRHRLEQDIRKTERSASVMKAFFRIRELGLPKSGDQDIFVVKGATVDDWATAACNALRTHNVEMRQLNQNERLSVLLLASAEYARQVGRGGIGTFSAHYPEVAARFVENLDRPGIGPDLFAPHSSYQCIWKCVHGTKYLTKPQKASVNLGTSTCVECNVSRSAMAANRRAAAVVLA